MPSRLFERVAVRTPPARRAAALPLSIAVHAAAVAGVLAVPVALPVPIAPSVPPLMPVVVRADDTRALPRVPPRPPRVRTMDLRHRSVSGPTIPAGHQDRPPTVGNEGPALSGPPSEVPDPGDAPALCLHDCGGAPDGAGVGPVGDPDGIAGVKGEPVRIRGQITPPQRTRYVAPRYPPLARDAGLQGVVILDCTIGPDGRVENVRILSGHSLLDGAAVEAVRQWAYRPTLLNGVPVRVLMTVTVNFVLRR